MPLAGAWRKRQRKCKHFLNQQLQGLGRNDNNKTPNLKEDRGFVVPLAGLEPARMLLRGILRQLRIVFNEKLTYKAKCENGAILHEKQLKMPQNEQLHKNYSCSDFLEKTAKFPKVPKN